MYMCTPNNWDHEVFLKGGHNTSRSPYICCNDGYDEDARLCTAARRPPVEETSSFLKSLLASHGPNYLEKLFGPKARNNMQQLGGVNAVAIALSGEENVFFCAAT